MEILFYVCIFDKREDKRSRKRSNNPTKTGSVTKTRLFSGVKKIGL